MADTAYPDKWVRRAISDALDGTVVSGNTIPVFDMQATNFTGDHYILMTTQSDDVLFNKCGDGWNHSIVLDIVTSFRKNHGSRLLVDQIVEAIIPSLNSLTLHASSSMTINRVQLQFPGDFTDQTEKKIFHRKILRLELDIN
ncbi:MAG TPA: hypothetical protein VMW91_10800 [Desulfosporosinus sp.]|nr:hypothetical protein [Desulfosporosinus sp.]